MERGVFKLSIKVSIQWRSAWKYNGSMLQTRPGRDWMILMAPDEQVFATSHKASIILNKEIHFLQIFKLNLVFKIWPIWILCQTQGTLIKGSIKASAENRCTGSQSQASIREGLWQTEALRQKIHHLRRELKWALSLQKKV